MSASFWAVRSASSSSSRATFAAAASAAAVASARSATAASSSASTSPSRLRLMRSAEARAREVVRDLAHEGRHARVGLPRVGLRVLDGAPSYVVEQRRAVAVGVKDGGGHGGLAVLHVDEHHAGLGAAGSLRRVVGDVFSCYDRARRFRGLLGDRGTAPGLSQLRGRSRARMARTSPAAPPGDDYSRMPLRK